MTYDDFISTDRRDVDSERPSDERGPMVCRECGGDCVEADWCDATRRWTCIHCADRRNSQPEDFSGEAA